MKVKIIKLKTYFSLVCDDEQINEKYGCSQEKPITLATLTTWENTGCWKIRDLRLEQVFYPTQSLEGNNLQKYTPVDETDRANLISQLNYYKETPEGEIRWGTFHGVVGMGDRTDHPDNPTWIAQSVEGCWSYNGARSKFKEICDFWRKFEGDDLKSAMMVNPHKQITETDFRIFRGDYSSPKIARKNKM